MIIFTWRPSRQKPREAGWYVVEKIADDGDGRTDNWFDTHYWNGKTWDASDTCFNRWFSRRFGWKDEADPVLNEAACGAV